MASKSKSSMNQVVDIIHDKIKNNQDILKLLITDNENVDIYELPELTLPQIIEGNKHIHDGERMPLENVKECYICLWYGTKGYHHKENSFFSGNTFNIAVVCDKDILYNKHVGDRTCEIEHAIAEMFDKKPITKTCMCEMNVSEYANAGNTNYVGRKIQLRFNDLNKHMVR